MGGMFHVEHGFHKEAEASICITKEKKCHIEERYLYLYQ